MGIGGAAEMLHCTIPLAPRAAPSARISPIIDIIPHFRQDVKHFFHLTHKKFFDIMVCYFLIFLIHSVDRSCENFC